MESWECARAIFYRLREDKAGVTALEYGLIGSFIFLAIVISVGAVGTNLAPIFTHVAGHM